MIRSDTNHHRSAVDGRAVLVAVALTLVVTATAGFAVGTAVAGDRVAVITPSPYAVEAEPGETFTVDLTMRSDGGHGGEGVRAVDLVAQYHPDYLEITDVEAGPWLEQGEETDVRTERTLAHEAGTAVLEQRREPVAGGATGTDGLATITVEVAADAEPADAAISFGESDVDLRSWPLPVDEQAVTVSIDGGGDDAPAFDHPDPATLETAATPDSADGEAAADPETSPEPSVEGDAADGVPGFTGPAALLAFATALVAARHGHRRRHR